MTFLKVSVLKSKTNTYNLGNKAKTKQKHPKEELLKIKPTKKKKVKELKGMDKGFISDFLITI